MTAAGAAPAGSVLREHRLFAMLLLVLGAGYLGFTWGGHLADPGGDLPAYLFAAQQFAPYLPRDPLGAIISGNSQFPPLYPLFLALTGGAADLTVAHAMTAACALAAFVAFYAWLLSLGISRTLAAAAAGVFAILPSTYLQSLVLYADSLYLLLSLLFLLALARGEESRRPRDFWKAAGLAAAALVTRTAGVALLPAFALALWRWRPRGWIAMAAAAVAPAALWALVHRPENSYTHAFAQMYAAGSLGRMVAGDARDVGIGLLRTVLATPTMAWAVAALWLVAGVVAARRLRAGAADAVYLFAYLAMAILWPYPQQAVRLAWMIVPLLLGYLLLGLRSLPQPRLRALLPAGVLATLALLVAPSLALTAQRYSAASQEADPAVRQLPVWYSESPTRVFEARFTLAMASAIGELSAGVPQQDCIYSGKAPLVTYYGRRASYAPPIASVRDADFEAWLAAHSCHYLLLLAPESPGRPPFYPAERLRGRFDFVADRRMKDGDGWAPVAALVRLK